MPSITHYWKTRDGRRIAVNRLEDDHLVSILQMALRARRREALEQALEGLGHACAGDDGAQYIGELQYDDELRKAHSLAHLRDRLEQSARYAPLVAEALRRGLRWTRPRARKTH